MDARVELSISMKEERWMFRDMVLKEAVKISMDC
jgi:hypothetical protein